MKRKLRTVLALAFFSLLSAVIPVQAQEKESVYGSVHMQDIGWREYKSAGDVWGTTGQSKSLQAVKMELSGVSGSILYKVHVRNIGWMDWKRDGQQAGTTGQNLPIEAIQIKLTGAASQSYNLYYRVHLKDLGWLGWTKDGAKAGSEGCGIQMEAFQVRLCKKGTSSPSLSKAFVTKPTLTYKAHVSDIGWQNAVKEGVIAGTTGQAKQIECVVLSFNDFFGGSGIEYRTHIQDQGWSEWTSSGKMSGTTGKNRRIEAIQIRLTGNVAAVFDIYYRVHVADKGWLGWTGNGNKAGTEGGCLRMEALQIKLVTKGSAYNCGGAAFYDLSSLNDSVQIQTNSSYESRVEAFLADPRWRPGVWYGGSQRPKLSSYSSSGCCAYTADFVKYVFGKNAPTAGAAFYDPGQITGGDVIKVLGSQHWFVVLHRNGNVLDTVEGNWTNGTVVRCNQYCVSGNRLLRNGKVFRTFAVGYHFGIS